MALKQNKTKKKKGPVREWIDALVFAVIAATIIRWLLIEAFTIPTPSMEKSLLTGDYLFVSKMHYGARAPITPLQIPLTHQKIWGTDIPSYLSWLQLPYLRLPGFTSVKNNDVVVFNLPNEHDEYPVDLRTNYIKRCVAIAGDELEIKEGDVFINGQLLAKPPKWQTSYLVSTKNNGEISRRKFKDLEITDHVRAMNGYIIQTDAATAGQLKSLDIVVDVTDLKYMQGTEGDRLFPNAPGYGWTQDNFGPLKVPQKGMTVSLDSTGLDLYADLIVNFERNKNAELKGGKLYLGGNAISEYTFRQDYYFMMGDNRHNSLDSRFWGFVPGDHVLGKGLLVWFSLDPDPEKGLFARIRWNRIFSLIR